MQYYPLIQISVSDRNMTDEKTPPLCVRNDDYDTAPIWIRYIHISWYVIYHHSYCLFQFHHCLPPFLSPNFTQYHVSVLLSLFLFLCPFFSYLIISRACCFIFSWIPASTPVIFLSAFFHIQLV